MKHVMKALNEVIGGMKNHIERLQERNEKLFEEANRLAIENEKLKSKSKTTK
jgi:regulator of replication initiation timing